MYRLLPGFFDTLRRRCSDVRGDHGDILNQARIPRFPRPSEPTELAGEPGSLGMTDAEEAHKGDASPALMIPVLFSPVLTD